MKGNKNKPNINKSSYVFVQNITSNQNMTVLTSNVDHSKPWTGVQKWDFAES